MSNKITIFNTRSNSVRNRLALPRQTAVDLVRSTEPLPIELLITLERDEAAGPLLPDFTEVIPTITIVVNNGDKWGRVLFTLGGQYVNHFHGSDNLYSVSTDVVKQPLYLGLDESKNAEGELVSVVGVNKEDGRTALNEFAFSTLEDFLTDFTGMTEHALKLKGNRIANNLGIMEVGGLSKLYVATTLFITAEEFKELIDLNVARRESVLNGEASQIASYFTYSTVSITPIHSDEAQVEIENIIKSINITLTDEDEEEVKEEVVLPM